MSIPCDINPAPVLGAIRESLIAEAMQAGGAATIALRRDIVWLVIASIGEVIDRVDVLAESTAVADRLGRELAISRAETERQRQKADVLEAMIRRHPAVVVGVDLGTTESQTLYRSVYQPFEKAIEERRRPWDPAGKGRLERDHQRMGVVVDISDALARERRDAGRPIGPEGGAA